MIDAAFIVLEVKWGKVPWGELVTVAGAITVALLTGRNQGRADKAVAEIGKKAKEFEKAIDTLDRHFVIQSELLEKAIDGGKKKR